MLSAKGLMCLSMLAGACVSAPGALAVTPTNDLWSKFEAVQQGTRALHQEFEVTRHVKSGYVDEVFRFQLTLDFSQGKWREQPVGGLGEQIRIFDGHDLFVFESGGKEYAHPKVNIDKDKPLPDPYETRLDWNKMKEVQRLPCGFSGKDHTCVIIEAPIKPWLRPGSPGGVIRMNDGVIQVMADTETGIWLRIHVSASVGYAMGSAPQWDVFYNSKQMSYGAPPAWLSSNCPRD